MMAAMELSDGRMPWLFELGMEGQTFLSHVDSLSCPNIEPVPLSYQHGRNNADLGVSSVSFQEKDDRSAAIRPIKKPCCCQHATHALANQEQALEISKLNPWAFFSGQPAQAQKEFHHEEHSSRCCLLPGKQFQLQPHLTSHAGSLLSSLPQLNNEIHESVAPETPTVCFEVGISERSVGNECHVADQSSNAVSGSWDMPLSPSGSGIGGNKSRVFSAQDVGTAPKCDPASARASNNTRDHIMAERKRREKLTQHFIALSAILPGLKKMDKASVLGDTIKYVKQMQERLKELEEQLRQRTATSVRKAKKPSVSSSASSQAVMDVTCVGGNEGDNHGNLEPDIEVRMAGKNVLIRIHCEKRKGILVNALAELEKLQLSVINANLLSFSETAFDLTYTAQVEEDCVMSAEDVVMALQNFLKKFFSWTVQPQ